MSPTRGPSALRLALRRGGLLAALAALLGLAARDALARYDMLDTGRWLVSHRGTVVRAEEFAFERFGDSLVVRAASGRWTDGQTRLDADMSSILICGALDYAMGKYWSQRTIGRDTLRRGIEVPGRDTVFTVWREHNGAGVGDVFALPPGRLYIMDPPLFTSFAVIGWTVRDKPCNHRPIHVVALGDRDTMFDATVTDAGNDSLSWNGQKVLARRLAIDAQGTTFDAWFTPDGHMLRLEQPQAALRAEREGPTPEDEPGAPAKK